jgi:hypothetical protein
MLYHSLLDGKIGKVWGELKGGGRVNEGNMIDGLQILTRNRTMKLLAIALSAARKRRVGETECLCIPGIPMLKSNLQYDGIWNGSRKMPSPSIM